MKLTLLLLGLAVLVLLLLWRWLLQRRELARLRRQNRQLLTLSQASRMILRARSEDELWRDACDICVDSGKALLACVYRRDGMLIHRVASAGPAAQILANVPSTLDMNVPELRSSYTAQVLLDGARRVSNDYVLDPRAGRWREEAVAQGVRSIAWIPLRRGGATVATLMLCSGRRDNFDAALLPLLDGLGEDLSLALDRLEDAKAAPAQTQAEH